MLVCIKTRWPKLNLHRLAAAAQFTTLGHNQGSRKAIQSTALVQVKMSCQHTEKDSAKYSHLELVSMAKLNKYTKVSISSKLHFPKAILYLKLFGRNCSYTQLQTISAFKVNTVSMQSSWIYSPKNFDWGPSYKQHFFFIPYYVSVRFSGTKIRIVILIRRSSVHKQNRNKMTQKRQWNVKQCHSPSSLPTLYFRSLLLALNILDKYKEKSVSALNHHLNVTSS